MTRFIPGQSEEQVTYHQLAVQGINQFLDYLSSTSKLEYVSLVSVFFIYLHGFVSFIFLIKIHQWILIKVERIKTERIS